MIIQGIMQVLGSKEIQKNSKKEKEKQENGKGKQMKMENCIIKVKEASLTMAKLG